MISLRDSRGGADPASLPKELRETSGCSYEPLARPPCFVRSDDERRSRHGVGSMLSDYYEEHRSKFDGLPKTKEEAALRGEKTFDGLQVSVCPFTDIYSAEIAPIRYSFLRAYQELRSELIAKGDLSGVAALERENPYILGAAVYAVTRWRGEPCIMMQIKGNAVGAGQIHSALAAGGISMQEFESATSISDMLQAAAVRQASEELGLRLQGNNLGDPAIIRYEGATGNIGIGYILQGIPGSEILDRYVECATKRKITSSDDTAAGVVLMPTNAIAVVSLDGDVPALSTRTEVIVTKNGGEIVTTNEPRRLRPAAQGFLAALADPKFLTLLLERSGI